MIYRIVHCLFYVKTLDFYDFHWFSSFCSSLLLFVISIVFWQNLPVTMEDDN